MDFHIDMGGTHQFKADTCLSMSIPPACLPSNWDISFYLPLTQTEVSALPVFRLPAPGVEHHWFSWVSSLPTHLADLGSCCLHKRVGQCLVINLLLFLFLWTTIIHMGDLTGNVSWSPQSTFGTINAPHRFGRTSSMVPVSLSW